MSCQRMTRRDHGLCAQVMAWICAWSFFPRGSEATSTRRRRKPPCCLIPQWTAMLINSGEFNDSPTKNAIQKMTAFAEQHGFGKKDRHIQAQGLVFPCSPIGARRSPCLTAPNASRSGTGNQLPVLLPDDVDITCARAVRRWTVCPSL